MGRPFSSWTGLGLEMMNCFCLNEIAFPPLILLSSQILECAPMWPQLEDLCVEENSITELQR